MTKLSFQRTASRLFLNQELDSTTITHKVDVTDTTFKYQLVQLVDGVPVVLYNTQLNINEILNHSRFSEQSFWACMNHVLTPELTILDSSVLVNKGNLSLATKTSINPSDGTNSSGAKCPWVVFVPHKNATFSECTIRLIKPDEEPNSVTTVNVESTDNCVLDPRTLPIHEVITNIECTTQEVSSDTIKVQVSVNDVKITKVYLEPVCGILDRTVVTLTNGVGTFNILTNTLSSGDTVEVKLGYKHYSSVVKYNYAIV